MKIRDGKAASDELYEKSRKDLLPLLQRLIPAKLRRMWDAEDLFHEAFLRAVARLDEFEWRGESSWRNYLLKTAKNCILDAQKRKSMLNVRLEHGEPEGGIRASKVPAGGVRGSQDVTNRDVLGRVFSGMSEDDVALLRLKLMEGLTNDEIAGRLGKKTDAVRKALQRARARFETLARELDSSL